MNDNTKRFISPPSVGVKSSSSLYSLGAAAPPPPLTPLAHSGVFESVELAAVASYPFTLDPVYPKLCKRTRNTTNSAHSPPHVVDVRTLAKSASTSASTRTPAEAASPPDASSSSPSKSFISIILSTSPSSSPLIARTKRPTADADGAASRRRDEETIRADSARLTRPSPSNARVCAFVRITVAHRDDARVGKPAALDARAAEEPPPLDAANVSITAERAERARATARNARERRMVSVSRVARGRARRDGRAARCEDVEFKTRKSICFNAAKLYI